MELDKMNRVDEVRSDEVQEILNHTPNWMIRWGITAIFFLIAILVFISWFVKYPDTVQANVVLTTSVPPARLVSQSNGYIKTLMVHHDEWVKEGTPIALITNPTNKKTIKYLGQFIDDFSFDQLHLYSNELDSLEGLGEIQAEVSLLSQNIQELNILNKDEYYQKRIKHLKEQIRHYNKLIQIGLGEKNLQKGELTRARERYQDDSLLFTKGVIAKHSFYERKSSHTTQQQQYINQSKNLIQLQVSHTQYKDQLNNLIEQQAIKKRNLENNILASMRLIKTFHSKWKQSYLIEAPFDGKLSYLESISENDYVTILKPLFAVIPNNNKIIGNLNVAIQGFGKLAVGQKVRMKMDSYPHHEFGQLIGEVISVSDIPSTEGYSVQITLSEGLISTYGKELKYKPEMSGIAEVITEDLRLMERIFNSFRKLLDK